MIYRYALPFPVAPGKTDADAGSITAYFQANMDQYGERRKRLGTTMERVYLQATPMGSIVIAYVETVRGFGEWIQALVTSDLEIDRRFVTMWRTFTVSTSGSRRLANHPRRSGSGSILRSPPGGGGWRSWHRSCPGKMIWARRSRERRSLHVGRSSASRGRRSARTLRS